MIWGLAATLGAGAINTIAGLWGASKASQAQDKANKRMINYLEKMQEQIRGDLAPYRQFGENALMKLTTGRSPMPPQLMSLMEKQTALQGRLDAIRQARIAARGAYRGFAPMSPEAMHFRNYGIFPGETRPFTQSPGVK